MFFSGQKYGLGQPKDRKDAYSQYSNIFNFIFPTKNQFDEFCDTLVVARNNDLTCEFFFWKTLEKQVVIKYE